MTHFGTKFTWTTTLKYWTTFGINRLGSDNFSATFVTFKLHIDAL